MYPYTPLYVGKNFQIKNLYTAFMRQIEYHFDWSGEVHNFYELVSVIDGSVGVTANNEVYTLNAGQAILHEPMEFHNVWAKSDNPTIVVFTFDSSYTPHLTSKIFNIKSPQNAVKILEQLHTCHNFDMHVVREIKPGYEIESQITVKMLETYILEAIVSYAEKLKVDTSVTAKNFSTIVTVLNNNIEKSLTVADIANLCNMSEINVKKTFKRYSNMGVIKYFNQLKINNAITKMRGGMSVKETANALGFSSQNYFSTTFKRFMGVSPANYKF